jgi:Tfp pilus assembly protein PilN
MAINLIPPELKRIRNTERLLRKALRIAVVVAILILATSGVLFYVNSNASREIGRIESDLERLTTENDQYANLEDEIADINKKLVKIDGVEKNRILWSSVLTELARCTPAKLSLGTLSLSQDNKKVTLTGVAETRRDIALYKEKLDASDLFKNVLFSSSAVNETDQNFTFSLSAELEKTK